MSNSNLLKIAQIRTGYQFREKAPIAPDGQYSVLQLRDADNARLLDDQEFQKVAIDNVKSSDLVEEGDVLLRSKGNHHYAVYVDRPLSNCLASGLVLVIKCDRNELEPRYLTWFLNQAPAQAFLNKISAGTSIPVVGKKPLLELIVPLPAPEKQIAIGSLYQLLLKEERLERQLLEARQNFLNHKMLSLVEATQSLNLAR